MTLQIPEGIDAIVDISNITPRQLLDIHRMYLSPLYVSTHKSFNFLVGTGKHESFHKRAMWLVLRVPYDTDGQTNISIFDAKRQTFTRKSSHSPLRIKYKNGLKPSQCSILSDLKAFPYDHALCEIDDMIIAFLAAAKRLPVITNDRLLKDIVEGRTHAWDANLKLLSKHTLSTLLRRQDQKWVQSTDHYGKTPTKRSRRMLSRVRRQKSCKKN